MAVVLRCGACGCTCPCMVDAHDEGPNGPSKWYVPMTQPLVQGWSNAHHLPAMEPTGLVVPA